MKLRAITIMIFISSLLLLVAPAARAPIELRVAGPLVSQPYIRMTLAVMCAFGVESRCSTNDSPHLHSLIARGSSSATEP